MASISTDKNGLRRIQFIGADGTRRAIRLGKMPLKDVREIKTKVEALNAAAIAGNSWDTRTAEWVGDLSPVLYDKLAVVLLLPTRVDAERFALSGWLESYISGRADVKGTTAIVYGHTKRCLIGFFGADRAIDSITPGDADAWRIWLDQHEKLADNTVRRRCGIAKQFFRAAQRRRLIVENPFADLKGIGVRANKSRNYFLSLSDAQKVLDACPDAEWRLIFALSRFAGLRCPSEHLGLHWGDVDWERGRLTVHSPKTAHHGKESRIVPIFPELRPHLEGLWEQAEPGNESIITRYRAGSQNLRTQFERIIRRAGLEPWPKPFQNLRSTCETELAAQHPIQAVVEWLGNTQAVALRHYLQVTDADFDRAITKPRDAAQNPAQSGAVSPQDSPHAISTGVGGCVKPPENSACAPQCGLVNISLLGGTGLEPVTSTV